MNKTAAHKAGAHEELVTSCRVCDDVLAFFLRFGETMPRSLEDNAIEEAEFDETVPDDWYREGGALKSHMNWGGELGNAW